MANGIHPAARALHLSLLTRDASALGDLACLLRAHLSPNEQTFLALAALLACDEGAAAQIAAAATSGEWAPQTFIPMTMESARAWTASSTSRQRKAIVAACIEAMSVVDRAGLANWLLELRFKEFDDAAL